MKKASRYAHSTLNELNITPLLDLVFVLLVIFIITTPQMMNNLEMTLPSGKPPQSKPDQPKPKINKIVSVYLTSTSAPASTNFALIDSASSLETPSLTGFGAPSTK